MDPNDKVFPSRTEIHHDLQARVDSMPWYRKVVSSMGRRGAFLVSMGMLYSILGYAYVVYDIPTSQYATLAFPIKVLGHIGMDPVTALHAWGVFWMVSGLVAVVTCWWPPGWDFVGFVALWSFSSLWGGLNLMGALVLDAPRAEITGLVFITHAISIAIVSGMVDPTAVSRLVEADINAKQ